MTVADCRHTPQCPSWLTHAFVISCGIPNEPLLVSSFRRAEQRRNDYLNDLRGRMTTTPDSRIRADWTLPAETAAPPPTVAPDTSTTATPDTSTTAGKIAVMQAYDAGVPCQTRQRHDGAEWVGDCKMIWDWERWDYRIAPPPVARTALQLSRERARVVLADEATAGDVQLAVLVREIDSSPLVIISMRTVGFGDEATPYPTIVQLVDGDPKSMQPGRYRLLRDDA